MLDANGDSMWPCRSPIWSPWTVVTWQCEEQRQNSANVASTSQHRPSRTVSYLLTYLLTSVFFITSPHPPSPKDSSSVAQKPTSSSKPIGLTSENLGLREYKTETETDYSGFREFGHGWTAALSWHSTTPTPTPTSSPTSSRGSSRECRRFVQLAAGITSGNRACRTCRRGCPCRSRCRCRRRGISAWNRLRDLYERRYLLNEARDEWGALSDDACRFVLFLLGTRHGQAVVHVTFQHQDSLVHTPQHNRPISYRFLSGVHCLFWAFAKILFSVSFSFNSSRFLARDVIYTSRAYATMSVPVCPSVYSLWRKCIVVTVHAGKRGGVIWRYAIATARPSCFSSVRQTKGGIRLDESGLEFRECIRDARV